MNFTTDRYVPYVRAVSIHSDILFSYQYNVIIMDTDNTLVTVEKYTLDVPDLPDYSDRIRYLVEASVALKDPTRIHLMLETVCELVQ